MISAPTVWCGGEFCGLPPSRLRRATSLDEGGYTPHPPCLWQATFFLRKRAPFCRLRDISPVRGITSRGRLLPSQSRLRSTALPEGEPSKHTFGDISPDRGITSRGRLLPSQSRLRSTALPQGEPGHKDGLRRGCGRMISAPTVWCGGEICGLPPSRLYCSIFIF